MLNLKTLEDIGCLSYYLQTQGMRPKTWALLLYVMFNFNWQLDTTWEDSPNKGLSILSWPIGMFRPLWVAPFPKKGFRNCMRMEKCSWAQAVSKHAFVTLWSWPWIWCDWLFEVSALTYLQWQAGTVGWNKPLCPLNCFLSHCFITAKEIKLKQYNWASNPSLRPTCSREGVSLNSFIFRSLRFSVFFLTLLITL